MHHEVSLRQVEQGINGLEQDLKAVGVLKKYHKALLSEYKAIAKAEFKQVTALSRLNEPRTSELITTMTESLGTFHECLATISGDFRASSKHVRRNAERILKSVRTKYSLYKRTHTSNRFDYARSIVADCEEQRRRLHECCTTLFQQLYQSLPGNIPPSFKPSFVEELSEFLNPPQAIPNEDFY